MSKLLKDIITEGRLDPHEIEYNPSISKMKAMTKAFPAREIRFVVGLKSNKLEAAASGYNFVHDQLLPDKHQIKNNAEYDAPSKGYPHIRGKMFYHPIRDEYKYSVKTTIHPSDKAAYGENEDTNVKHPVLDQLEKAGIKRNKGDFQNAKWTIKPGQKKTKNPLLEKITVGSFLKANKKELEETQPLHDELTNHYHKFTNLHKSNLRRYSNVSYGVNNLLWKEHKGETITPTDRYDAENEDSPDIDHLDSALAQHKTPHNLTIYSGTKHDPRRLMNSEKIVHHPAYLSASLGYRVARGFSQTGEKGDRHVLAINVPKGSSGAYIGEHSFSSDEKEFLLPRGSNLKYNKTEESKYEHPSFGMLKVHTHHMDLVK